MRFFQETRRFVQGKRREFILVVLYAIHFLQRKAVGRWAALLRKRLKFPIQPRRHSHLIGDTRKPGKLIAPKTALFELCSTNRPDHLAADALKWYGKQAQTKLKEIVGACRESANKLALRQAVKRELCQVYSKQSTLNAGRRAIH